MIELILIGFQETPALIDIIQTPQTQQVTVPLAPTVQEKIDSNFYNCNTDTQFIREDTAECKDKPVEPPKGVVAQKQVVTQSDVKTTYRPPTNGNTYALHNCTHGVKRWKPSVPNGLGNAKQWKSGLIAQGWSHSYTPVIGAVAWSGKGYYGHVALVVGFNANQVQIREQNYDWNGSIRTKWVDASRYEYLY